MSPNAELVHFNAQLKRVGNEHSETPRVLRLAEDGLRRLSKWKWEQNGWAITEGQACGIRNGNEQQRRTALMSVLKGHIQQIEFVPNLETPEVVLAEPGSARA